MLLRVFSLGLFSFLLLFAQNDSNVQSDLNLTAAGEPQDTPDTPPPLTCPGGAPLGPVNLRVRSPQSSETLPFQSINHLSEGDTVLYSPILRATEKRPGEVALVMVPAKHDPKQDFLIVSEPKRADRDEEWQIPETISLAAFVYGPQGLNKKKVKGFLSQDDQLVAQLADYAEKTTQTEALLEALSDNGSSPASMNAALNGFASQYGLSVQIDRTAPPAVQAQTLFATMNPQLATYNPLASSTAQAVGQTASVATAAATLFFGSPIGLAAGGTAMLLDLRAIAFPGTQFRSSFAQPRKTGVNLCGQRTPAPPHTRVAYIWATRIPNTHTPEIEISAADNIPETQRTPVPVKVPDAEWKYLQRVRQWELEDDRGIKTKVPIIKLGNARELEIDLDKVDLAPGDYHLTGFWDWTPFKAIGDIHIRPLSQFKDARLDAASQNRLLAHGGKVPVTLIGSDFEFTTKVEVKKVGDEFATAEPARFVLPKGLRLGPQGSMDVLLDTASLEPGLYSLLISQQDGKTHSVDVNVLPNAPKIDNLPILVNQGVTAQHYVLKGERLNLVAKLEAENATFDLGPTANGDTERNLTVQLKTTPAPNTKIPVKAILEDRTAALTLPDALQITGPLPVVASSKLSLPSGMKIAIKPNEFPAGYMLTAVLDVKNIEAKSLLHLTCAEGNGSQSELRIGEQTATASLQQLSPDQLFLSYDTSTFPAGCTLEASIDNGRDGRSAPFTLAHLIRVPAVESFQLDAAAAGSQPPAGLQNYDLTGTNLEMIEKVGWDGTSGVDVPGLPTPIPGKGQQQSLTIGLPEPPNPQAPLVIWLRGESSGRATAISLQNAGKLGSDAKTSTRFANN